VLFALLLCCCLIDCCTLSWVNVPPHCGWHVFVGVVITIATAATTDAVVVATKDGTVSYQKSYYAVNNGAISMIRYELVMEGFPEHTKTWLSICLGRQLIIIKHIIMSTTYSLVDKSVEVLGIAAMRWSDVARWGLFVLPLLFHHAMGLLSQSFTWSTHLFTPNILLHIGITKNYAQLTPITLKNILLLQTSWQDT
jgi:hypothetical protein